ESLLDVACKGAIIIKRSGSLPIGHVAGQRAIEMRCQVFLERDFNGVIKFARRENIPRRDCLRGPDKLLIIDEGRIVIDKADIDRSEEHTSELQARENLVCRLLLGKKKMTARE